MASRHFSVKHGKVGQGGKHALYVAGQGKYADKDDVIYLLDVNMPSWARDGADFFAAADKMERANGRTYTEFEFAIPREIANAITYAKEFAYTTLGNSHPYRLAVHDKLASDGGRNIHAHLMFTERRLDGIERDASKFFLRANPKAAEKGGAAKDRKWHEKHMVKDMRQVYSDFAKSYGVELDLRSNIEQGLDEAEPKIGPVHDRSGQNKNRANLIMKVESLREGRFIEDVVNSSDRRLQFDLQKQAKERRKQLWTNFHGQRRSNYSRLADEFRVNQIHQKAKLALIKSSYLTKREALNNDHSLKYVERRAAISIANMERITQELKIKAEFEAIRQAIKTEQSEHYFEKYRSYLESQTQLGDEVAQAELDRLIANNRKTPKEQNSIVAIQGVSKFDPARLNLKYEVSKGGEVTYKMHDIDVIKDVGKRVDLLQTDDLTIETALRLAQARFGANLTLAGSREFQERAARVAVERGLKVEFADPAINKIMREHKQELAAQRDMRIIERHLGDANKKLQKLESLNSATQELIRANVANLAENKQMTTMLVNHMKESLAEAEMIARTKGFDVVKSGSSKYRGSVVEITSHHVIQNIGKGKVIVHELAKFESVDRLRNGALYEFNYQTSIPKATLILEMDNQKPRTR
jgi:predicted RNase H-related nuclease YkuK (DUF458 family)